MWRRLCVALLGLALIYGSILGGQLQRLSSRLGTTLDTALIRAGFATKNIEVAGLNRLTRAAIISAIAPETDKSTWAFDTAAAQQKLQQLPWVKDVSIMRLLPSTMRIEVKERVAVAVWQIKGDRFLLDAENQVIERVTKNRGDDSRLPLFVGDGAPEGASEILTAVKRHPEFASRVKALVRVANRRWNIALTSGQQILLPEDKVGTALTRLADLQSRRRLLEQPITAIDLRIDGRITLQRKQRNNSLESPLEDPISRQLSGVGMTLNDQADGA